MPGPPILRFAPLLLLIFGPAGAKAQQGPDPGLEGGTSGGGDAGMAADTAAPPADPESGFEYGLRSGVAFPFGDVEEGRPLGDDVNLRIPVWVDIGYRLNPTVYLALYAQVGLYGNHSDCARRLQVADVECNAEDSRLGVEALFHLPVGGLDAWVGVGAGWEWLEQSARFTVEGDPTPPDEAPLTQFLEQTETQKGPTLDLQAGLDLPVHGALKAGPFVGYTLGSFVDRACRRSALMAESSACPRGTADGGTTVHHWAAVGLRGSYGP